MKTSRRMLLALLALLLLAGCVTWLVSHRKSFDPAVWRNRATSDSVRLQMADDLVRNHKLKGLTKVEVVTLLGQPPQTPYFKAYDLVYYLGPERGFMSIDSEWLIVKLGADGRVAEAKIGRD